MTIDNMGVTNQNWGVCGFTSSFYAMYKLQPNTRPQLDGASRSHLVLAEIKTYLNILKAEGELQTLTEIVDFTQSFGEAFADFSIDGYIDRVNDSVGLTEQEINDNALYGIAMPPDTVVDYLSRIWGVNSQARDVYGGDAETGNGILGVTSNPEKQFYHGLEHYLYRHNNRIYSWGGQYESVSEAGVLGARVQNWSVCYYIPIT